MITPMFTFFMCMFVASGNNIGVSQWDKEVHCVGILVDV